MFIWELNIWAFKQGFIFVLYKTSCIFDYISRQVYTYWLAIIWKRPQWTVRYLFMHFTYGLEGQGSMYDTTQPYLPIRKSHIISLISHQTNCKSKLIMNCLLYFSAHLWETAYQTKYLYGDPEGYDHSITVPNCNETQHSANRRHISCSVMHINYT